MKTITVTKEFVFDAAHWLTNNSCSLKENKIIYGKCNNLHGHTFKLLVTVSGVVGVDGFVINFNSLKTIVQTHIIEKLDHKLINDVDFMKGKVCTCENLLQEIWNVLDYQLRLFPKYVRLKKLRLYETPTSYAEMEVK